MSPTLELFSLYTFLLLLEAFPVALVLDAERDIPFRDACALLGLLFLLRCG